MLLTARYWKPENTFKIAILALALFLVVRWLSLRRCSVPELPAFRGLLLLTSIYDDWDGELFTALRDPSNRVRNCRNHGDCSFESHFDFEEMGHNKE